MWFNKIKNKKNKLNNDLSFDRLSNIDEKNLNIFPFKTKNDDILNELKRTYDAVEAIDLIINKTPDGKMAYNTFLRLANNGIKIEWYKKNKITNAYDDEFREFSSKIGKNNASGLDGLIDELHGSSIARGGMGFEVVIKSLKEGIEDVYPVDPASIVEWKWIPEKNRYAAYQMQRSGEKIDLFEGNFFFVPFQPKIGRPEGTLMFEPSIVAMTNQLQFQQDSLMVLHRIGYPRYHITINSEKLAEMYKNKSIDEIKKVISDEVESVSLMMRNVGKTNDFVTTDVINVNVIGGEKNGSGIDVRAWNDIIDVQVMNAFQILQVLMNRLKSGSYALSSVEYKIVTDTISSMRRGSKRLIEDLCRIWAQVKGYDISPKVEFNPIEWRSEIDKISYDLKVLEFNRRAEEYGYIGKDNAALKSMSVEEAYQKEENKLYEYLKHSFNNINETEQKNNSENIENTINENINNELDKNTKNNKEMGVDNIEN